MARFDPWYRAMRAPRRLFRHLGPGLITGAADDDPSGIATYSQAGAQFGPAMLWSCLFSYPLMAAVQLGSARLGRVTGMGLAANIRAHRSRHLLWIAVALLLVANTINIAADIAAMGDALQLLIGGGEHGHALFFGVALLFLQIFLPYRMLVDIFKWLTLALFAYVGVLLAVHIPWRHVVVATLVPRIVFNSDYLLTIVAVLGTTISPYLFFWQASQEVEEMREHNKEPLHNNLKLARKEFRRTRIDTLFGMGFSNLIAYFVMLTAATVLHPAGLTDIQTSAQAAEALRPIAGEYAFLLFSLGIIGTGLLAVPVLAGSAAYAVSEALGWREGLRFRWMEARGFYVIVAVATLGGTLLDFTPIDPIKALFWSAVVNGVIAVPIMALLMGLICDQKVMGVFVASPRVRWLGWLATAVMALLAVVMVVYLLK